MDNFINKYLKQILVSIATIILIMGSIIALRHFYLLHQEQNAAIALFQGEHYFSNRQWKTALKGDSIDYIGFLCIINEYRGTRSANLAKAYAGLCQYQLGQYEDALKSLKSYKATDRIFAAQITGAIGDCQVNLGNVKESITYFRKAAKQANNSLLSPIYMNKEAIAYQSIGDYKAALKIYTILKTEYPQSPEAISADKYIERAKIFIDKQ